MSTDQPDRTMQISIALQSLAKSVAREVTNSLDTCLSCEHFTESTEMCALYKARPPARVIAFACPSYVPDIPF